MVETRNLKRSVYSPFRRPEMVEVGDVGLKFDKVPKRTSKGVGRVQNPFRGTVNRSKSYLSEGLFMCEL